MSTSLHGVTSQNTAIFKRQLGLNYNQTRRMSTYTLGGGIKPEHLTRK